MGAGVQGADWMDYGLFYRKADIPLIKKSSNNIFSTFFLMRI